MMIHKLNSTQLPCYVINLHSAVERRIALQKMLTAQGVEPTFIRAVDGRIMDENTLNQHLHKTLALPGETLSKGEVGCALSHIAVYREIIHHGHEVAVVLEDDVRVVEDFHSLINLGSENCLSEVLSVDQPEVLQLTRVSRGYRFTSRNLKGGRQVIRPAGGVWLASGYIINRAGAKILADQLYPIWTVADNWGKFRDIGLIKLWAISPHIVSESELASTSSLNDTRKSDVRQPRRLSQIWRRVLYEIGRPLFTRAL